MLREWLFQFFCNHEDKSINSMKDPYGTRERIKCLKCGRTKIKVTKNE